MIHDLRRKAEEPSVLSFLTQQLTVADNPLYNISLTSSLFLTDSQLSIVSAGGLVVGQRRGSQLKSA